MNENCKINIYNDPYKHLIIENIFDKDCIKNIIKYFPKIKNLNNRTSIINKVPQNDRFVLYLDKKQDFVNLKNKDFWYNFYKNLYNKNFINKICKSLNLDIKNFHIQVQLICDKKNYQIPPHTDRKSNNIAKHITILTYINDEDNLDLGTELYTESEEGKINLKNRKFKLIKKAPYKTNFALAFHPINNVTWHGVSEIKENVIRKTIQIFFKPKRKIDYETIYNHKF